MKPPQNKIMRGLRQQVSVKHYTKAYMKLRVYLIGKHLYKRISNHFINIGTTSHINPPTEELKEKLTQ